jgi:hypothetical protein
MSLIKRLLRLFIVLSLLVLVDYTSIFAQSAEQKKLMSDIKNDKSYLFSEYNQTKGRFGKDAAIEQFFEKVKKSTQFTTKTQAIARNLNLPASVHLIAPKASILSAAVIEWERKNKKHFFVYLKWEEAIKQLATNYQLISQEPQEKWYLGQGIDKEQAISNQLATNNLSQHFGLLTNAIQTFVQSANSDTEFESYTQEITQQRTILLHGQQTTQLSWSPDLIASYSVISEKTIQKIDEELASEIMVLYNKAEGFLAQNAIEDALYNYYLAYLNSLLRFNEFKIIGESAQELLVSKFRQLLNEELSLDVGRAYSLNTETVAIPIILSHQNGIKKTYDLVYQDYTGETITQLVGGKGTIYLKNPISTTKDLVIPIKIAVQLNPTDKNNAKWSSVDDTFKGWVNTLLRINLSTVQKVAIDLLYNQSLKRYQLSPKTSHIDIQSVKWMVGNQLYQGSVLNLFQNEMSSLTVSMQLNENAEWVRSSRIDTLTQSIKSLQIASPFPREYKTSKELPNFYSFMENYRNPDLLIRELNRLKNFGKIHFGNKATMPNNGSYMLINFNHAAILHTYFVENGALYTIERNQLKTAEVKLSSVIEQAPALVWFKMKEEQ